MITCGRTGLRSAPGEKKRSLVPGRGEAVSRKAVSQVPGGRGKDKRSGKRAGSTASAQRVSPGQGVPPSMAPRKGEGPRKKTCSERARSAGGSAACKVVR